MKKRIVILIAIVVVVIIGMITFKKMELISDKDKVTDIFILYANYDNNENINYELCKEGCSANIQPDIIDLSERFEDVMAVLSDHSYANSPFTLAYNNDFLNHYLGLSLPYANESLQVIIRSEDGYDTFAIYKDLDHLLVNDTLYRLKGEDDLYQELSAILNN